MAEGKPESRAEKKALSHRRRENLSLLTWGKPRSFGEKKALSHRLRKYSALPCLGETPGLLAKRKA
jgi:hypothetical protein